MKTDILIVGAGPTGLGAAGRLEDRAFRDWLLIEREEWAGGLSASFRDEAGFTWDLGGHVIHSQYPRFQQFVRELLGAELLEHRRRAFVRVAGDWIPYPFQDNFHRLPAELRERCLRGLIEARERSGDSLRPSNLGQWVERTFGAGIAEIFMRPYNRKLWCCELTELSADWVSDRVSAPDLDRLLANAKAGRDDISFGANSSFGFPRSGGTGELWRRAALHLPPEKLRMSCVLEAVDLSRRVAVLAGGEEIGYRKLISTVPLTFLIKAAGLSSLAAAAAQLRNSSVEVLGLGLAGRPGPAVSDICWAYFPDPGSPFYRATVFSNYSPENVPAEKDSWSLMLEVARRPHWPLRPEDLWPGVIRSVSEEGLAPKEAGIISRWHRTIPYAYPIPSTDRDSALRLIMPVFEREEVYSRGRFGAWRYEVGNMDHCFMQGVEVVDRILDDEEETVVGPWTGSSVS